MVDPRVEKLAKVLIHYSLAVKKGEWVIIQGAYLAEDLMRAACIEVLSAGAHPTIHADIAGSHHLMFHRGNDEQIAFISPARKLEFKKADKFLFIMGGWNSKEMTGIDPKRMALAQSARKELMDVMMKRTAAGEVAWCGTLYPTHSSAQDGEMSLMDYEDFVFKGGMVDKKDPVAEWKKISLRQAELAKRLSRLNIIRVVGKDTDIKFRVAGRKWVNCDGRANFPDGEIFTCPLEDSVEGHIRYTFPAVYGGREVENVRLVFKKGRVVEATADKGAELLDAMLAADPGARRVGELAFGTNQAIKVFTKNTLFDEKIGGTMHVALGASLPEAGGKNKSA
ncbi:MAG: aminopeptidase, partial [Candidatus Eisenbacteria bacterium]|nr:aminopeptidase [Candidatus Eisenbacteria bacterium]